ncbi:DUF456 domain-containing protein [Luteimicrobium subarcticum]|uniref:DUF456 domain-containing protein n=1 Tax=Luteimicrobium subarcticum TaxID=620910 RepID=A0A2M8WV68_9MICO|nr:DUF456 domain-containing protein [Luteimicrobium subarcticum]PJI94818.1 hypothetical protein CLV34_0666 [Luteimicrobium subarcticum]
MSSGGEVVVGIVILLGLVGVVVQVLPGNLLVLGAILVWAILTGGTTAWVCFGVALACVAVAEVAQLVLGARHLRRAEVPWITLAIGGVVGVVGFFVVPVVGLPLGFVLGVLVVELLRRRDLRAAWAATVAAMVATGITIVVQLAGALLATSAWLVGVALT